MNSAISTSPLDNQWECIRQNIGTWHGAFVQFSPAGEQVSSTPSILKLEETAPDQTMALTLERFPEGGEKKVNRLTFTAPGPAPYTYFFTDGTFSQGSPQWSSFGQFGTEVSLKVGDRRVRYVIMYHSTSHYTSEIKYVTLICERQEGGTQFEEKALTAENLLGTWEGTAEVIYATGEPFTTGNSEWQLTADLSLACKEAFDNTVRTLRFKRDLEKQDTDGNEPITDGLEKAIHLKATEDQQLNHQLMLLPNGAYCLLPQEIKKEAEFRIEVGWIDSAGGRSRLVRYYDTRGVWTASALIKDQLHKR